jgi:hypothetical protein
MRHLVLILIAIALIALPGCSTTIAESELPQPGTTGLYSVARTGDSITVTGPVPTPTVTVTQTPLPAPTVTVTAEPSPTPSPTPSSGPDVPAGYTLVANQTIKNLVTNGLSNRYYYNCVFVGGSSVTAVLHFAGTSSNLVFDSCEIAAGPQNGITINDANGRIRDITFTGCVVRSQPRMGFECTSRPTSASQQYQRINLIGCTFNPQGNEAVSYDGGAAAGGSTVTRCTIEGAGANAAEPYGHGLEINGPTGMVVTGNHIWQTRGSAFNLKRSSSSDCGWAVTGNTLDSTHHVQDVPQDRLSQQIIAFNVVGGTFSGNTVISSSPGGSVAYWSGCRDMDWRTTVFRDASGRSGYERPTQVSCSGNRL